MSDDDDDQSPQDEGQRQRYILTHKRHKRHRYHQYNQWLSKSRLHNLMMTLLAPEDDKDPDRENEHLYMYLYISMMSEQLWNHKVA